jgi:hypothetical protein
LVNPGENSNARIHNLRQSDYISRHCFKQSCLRLVKLVSFSIILPLQYKKESVVRHTFTGSNIVSAAHPKGRLAFSPWIPFAHWAAISSVVLHDFLLTAGAAAPLSDFCGTQKSSSNAGRLRSTPFDLAAYCLGFAGIYPANCSHIRSRLATS